MLRLSVFDEIAKIWLQDQYQALTLDAAIAKGVKHDPKESAGTNEQDFGAVVDTATGVEMGTVEDIGRKHGGRSGLAPSRATGNPAISSPRGD